MFRMNGRPRAQGCAGAASFKLAQCFGCRAYRDVLVASPEERYLATSAPMQVVRLYELCGYAFQADGMVMNGSDSFPGKVTHAYGLLLSSILFKAGLVLCLGQGRSTGYFSLLY